MLIYVDTNIWIYAYENERAFGEPARQMLAHVKAQRHRLAGSLFVLGELLIMPTYKKNEFAIAAYRRLFAARQVALLPYGGSALGTYVRLRAIHRFKSMDALHLATASQAAAHLFVTQDEQILAQASRLKDVCRIVDLIQVRDLL